MPMILLVVFLMSYDRPFDAAENNRAFKTPDGFIKSRDMTSQQRYEQIRKGYNF